MAGERWVYVIGPEGGPFKIGVATSVDARRYSLQTGNPHRLYVIATWEHEAPRMVEAQAHRALADRRLQGEWFNVSAEEAVAAVAAIIGSAAPAIPDFPAHPPPEPSPPLVPDVELPPAPDVPDSILHRMGYARPIHHLPASPQAKWLHEAGVDQRDVFFDRDGTGSRQLNAAMKDMQRGRRLLRMVSGSAGNAGRCVAGAASRA